MENADGLKVNLKDIKGIELYSHRAFEAHTCGSEVTISSDDEYGVVVIDAVEGTFNIYVDKVDDIYDITASSLKNALQIREICGDIHIGIRDENGYRLANEEIDKYLKSQKDRGSER